MSIAGGLSELKPATAEIQQLVDQVKDAAEEKANMKFAKFEAKSFKSQVVAGLIYFVKVYVMYGNGYVHLRIYQAPHAGQPPKLEGIQLNKSPEDEILPFPPN